MSTENPILAPPSLWAYLFQAGLRWGGGGGVDRDGGLIWEEGLNKFSQDDGIIFPKSQNAKGTSSLWEVGGHYKLKIKNKSELPQASQAHITRVECNFHPT